MNLKWKLMVASLKMFFRQREAIIWTLLLPLFMVFLFSLADFGGTDRLPIGIVNNTGRPVDSILTTLQRLEFLDVKEGTQQDELSALEAGERDLVLVLFRESSGRTEVLAFGSEARQQAFEIASALVQHTLDEVTFQSSALPNRTLLIPRMVAGKNITYVDFLLPGVVSMSIMQLGVFGVAFSFVSLKKRGILRRLSVTPVRPGDFVTAQIVTRLIIVMLQIGLLVGVGVLVLDVHIEGGLAEMLVVGVLGAFVFLGIGFSIAGISRSEDQVAPIANIVAMPMILLSGVFFSRGHLPGVIQWITSFLPLTYLTNSMRAIAMDGASITQVGPDLVGLTVWALITGAMAVKLFRWE